MKNCKESLQRESEDLVMAEELACMGKADEHTRATCNNLVKSGNKKRLLLEAVQDRKQLEDEVLERGGRLHFVL